MEKDKAKKYYNYFDHYTNKYSLPLIIAFMWPTIVNDISILSFFIFSGVSFITLYGINLIARYSLKLIIKKCEEEEMALLKKEEYEEKHRLLDLYEYRITKNIKYNYNYHYQKNKPAKIIDFNQYLDKKSINKELTKNKGV